MSEAAPSSSVTVLPPKRRRWFVATLIALAIYGGACWWLNRLTPDEQIMVGRWEVTIGALGSSQTIKDTVEYRSDRTESTGGMMTHWTAKNGLIRWQNDRPFRDKVSNLIETLLRLRKQEKPDNGRYEIINHNKIIVDCQMGATPMRQVWTRILD